MKKDALMIFLSAFALLKTLEAVLEEKFAFFSSDLMMQTLPIEQLKQTPIGSLWYLHKQPPVFDAIRAILAQFFTSGSRDSLLLSVDIVLSYVWAIFFSAMASLVYVWIRSLSCRPYALVASVIWMFHPAPILYARYFDTTMLSSLVVMWLFYELWRFHGDQGSVPRLAAASLLLFYTRTVFQWYFFPVLLLGLALMKVSWRRIGTLATVVVVLTAPYLIRQYVLFGTTSTTTFSGYHECGIIWYRPSPEDIEEVRRSMNFVYPSGAVRCSGNDRWNTPIQAQENLIYSRLFKDRCKSDPLGSFIAALKSFQMNLRAYWTASSTFCDGYRSIVRSLAWTRVYNFVFSWFVLPWLLLIGMGIWVHVNRRNPKGKRGRVLGLILPLAYVFLICNLCNRYEWTEAKRLKFLLEPVFYVFIAAQCFSAHGLSRKFLSRPAIRLTPSRTGNCPP